MYLWNSNFSPCSLRKTFSPFSKNQLSHCIKPSNLRIKDVISSWRFYNACFRRELYLMFKNIVPRPPVFTVRSNLLSISARINFNHASEINIFSIEQVSILLKVV